MKDCLKHPPWPEGICTECQPSACRIDSQSYRHVDRVTFDTTEIVDKFLQFWRETGGQRCGYLYGKYMIDEHIPLGIQAIVSAIYEPPQKFVIHFFLKILSFIKIICPLLLFRSDRTGFVLEKDKDGERIDAVANMLGLVKIGFIWTDLQVDSSRRLIQSRVEYPLTGKEIITMAKMQNKSPSPCKAANGGYLGSKFVSLVITGNLQKNLFLNFFLCDLFFFFLLSFFCFFSIKLGSAKGDVSVSAYQVSDQCMQLVKDGIITFGSEPSLLRTKKTSKRFIPDIMFRKQNEYGREIVEKASPTFPLEFFIVRVNKTKKNNNNNK